jgi:hypothetical protein
MGTLEIIFWLKGGGVEDFNTLVQLEVPKTIFGPVLVNFRMGIFDLNLGLAGNSVGLN